MTRIQAILQLKSLSLRSIFVYWDWGDEQLNVGLRKRLGRGWVIETKAAQSETSSGSKGVALFKVG